MDISVVIPVREEEKNIEELVARLTATLETLQVLYEIIFVTDFNRDNTFGLLKSLSQGNERVKVIKLSNCYGQHTAVFAGLSFASGNAVIIMDGDLQDYPEDIPKLYSKLLEGFDVVYAEKERKNDSVLKNLSSKFFVKVLNILSDRKIQYNTCMFRIISRRTVEEILRFQEIEPSLTFLMGLIGFPSISIIVNSGQRTRGETKYSFLRYLSFAIDSLLSFSTKPLKIISGFGLIIANLSFIYMVITLVQKLFFNIDILGWTTIIMLITFFSGVQLMAIGITGEYIGKIFIQTKNRPLFIIEEKIGQFFEGG